MFSTKNCFIVMVCLLFTRVSSDMLEDERVSFFGLTHEVLLSPSTIEVVQQLELVVWQHARGDRRVRRYFDSYDSSFVGTRRSMDNDDIMLGEGDIME